ncbi:FHF complex subunit HOOK-interacting protein 2B isoform X2 [Pantherophis guttatus]|uniref:FHF complex subunit HOOK-interacting protein 2B isoform X2 n=1 Tax=Pantherophis guttatus TaxID=94885 RepID=A0A6P9D4P2_PANGU|nr:FHF complex subunit HOOK-interacting protein 2B isoform X2 [Pantherophis guttatus]
MALLGRLGSLLQRAVEAEEPRLDLPAAFTEHWKGVTHYYLEASDESKPAQQTDIPWRLKQMLDILVYEEKQQPEGETGPCLEYLLQHKILETLSTLGKAQYPPGMRSQVLLFFSRLLGQMQSPLMHYFNVYRPVQKLIQLQGDALGPEPEKEVLQFIAVLCTKIRQEPALLPYVLEGQKVGSLGLAARPSMTSGQTMPPSEEEGRELCPEKPLGGAPTASVLNLVTSLIGLCKSKNKKVVQKAQENLLLLTTVDHPRAAQALARDSMLCLLLSDYLCSLYNAIPGTINPADIATLPPVQWRLQSDPSAEESSFPGKASLEAFFGWLDFCDCLTKQAHPVIGDALSTTVGRRLFLDTLRPQLLQMSDSGILFSVAILTGLVRRIRAPALLQQLIGFLLGAEMDPVRPSDSACRQQRSNLCSQLIENCSHPSDEISVATLRLFEELVWLPDQRILQSLVLCHLEERSYVLRNPPGQEDLAVPEQECCEEGLDLEEDPYFADGLPAAVLQRPSKAAPLAPEEGPGQPEGPVDVKEAVSSFLCLVPSEVKTSPYLEEAGYDTYVHDAKVLFQECCANVAHWTWPQVQTPQKTSPAGPQFYEGRFLQVLFDRLSQILHQPYALNLQVTSMLSRLALFPHPRLHEYLLDPYLPLAPGCRTLFSVLIRVIGSLMHTAHRITDFSANLLLVRRKLMGLVSDEHPIGHQMLLEGVIVLEEFCKELAAIVFVKSALKDPPGQSQPHAPSPS